MTTLKDIKEFVYKGVTVTVQRRPYCVHDYEYGYRTSNNITGIGQDSVNAAERAAMLAIDQHLEEEPETCHRCGDALDDNWVNLLTANRIDEEYKAWLKEQDKPTS